jgi:hypothetical protein
MDLINSVTGVDDEGRSRQRILTFAARRYHNYPVLLAHQLRWYFLIYLLFTVDKSFNWLHSWYLTEILL